eukprot:203485-Hanusia_phi.AAC.5
MLLVSGGSVSRRLLASEAKELNRNFPSCFNEGETLANLALKWDNEAVEDLEGDVDLGDGSVKVLSLVLANVTEAGDTKDQDVNGRAPEEVRELLMPEFQSLERSPLRSEMSGEGAAACGGRMREGRHPLHSGRPQLPSDSLGNHQLRRLWLQACLAAYDNSTNPITAYLEAGGERNRALTSQDIDSLKMSNCFRVRRTDSGSLALPADTAPPGG